MDKVDSNIVGGYIAEEASLKTLGGSPVWYELEPNSWEKFGGETETKARTPINASRQRKKGVVVGVKASGGYNTDVTQSNLPRLLQGFFFADAHEKANTAPLNGTQITLTGVTASNEFTAASGLTTFKVGHLVMASGFGVSANNGLAKVTTVIATKVTTNKTLTLEASPPAAAKLEAVGYEFASGDATITVTGGLVTLATTTADFTTMGLNPGEWVCVGDDTAGNRFANFGCFYGRVKSVAAHALVFESTTLLPVNDTGAGKTIRIYFGTFIRNEKTPSLIKQRSYQLERQLGNDGNGIQCEYAIGAGADSLKLHIPKKDKLNVDLGFVALDSEFRNGTLGPKSGTRVAVPLEDAYNSTSHIYRMQMEIVDTTTPHATPLFGYVSEASVEIKNGITANEAIGEMGGFSYSVGDFEVSGSAMAYFTTIAAVQAVRDNASVAMNIIAAMNNAGFVYDMPLVQLEGSQLDVKKDAPVMIPLKNNAAENPLGFTLAATYFNYLPTVGMA